MDLRLDYSLWQRLQAKLIPDQKTENVSAPDISLGKLIQLQYPARLLNLTSEAKTVYTQSGQQNSPFRGRGMDFSEVRAYQAGDEIRNMDWRVTARTGRAHTKLFTEERERPVYILIDYSPSMFFGTQHTFKSAIAAELATLFAWATLQAGDKVGAEIFSADYHRSFSQNGRKSCLLPILKILAKRTNAYGNMTHEAHFTDAIKRLRRVVRSGAQIILISDFRQFNADTYQQLTLLAGRNNITACFVFDRLERELPPPGYYTICDQEERSVLDAHNATLRKNFLDAFLQRLDDLQLKCNKLGIPLLEFSTQDDVVKRLQSYYRKRERA